MTVGDIAKLVVSPLFSEKNYNRIRNVYNKTRYDLLWSKRSVSSFPFEGYNFNFVIVDSKDYIQAHHAKKSFYESDELKLLRQHFHPGTSFVDIGANTGQHGIFAAKALNAKEVIFFEPIPQTCRILRENIKLNPSTAFYDTSMIGVALSDRAGFADFRTTQINLGESSILTDSPGAIPLRTGDECLRDRSVDFIKLDTEGHEIAVLSVLENTIRKHRPVIFVEVDDNNILEATKLISAHNYAIKPLTKHYKGNQNFLFIPNSCNT